MIDIPVELPEGVSLREGNKGDALGPDGVTTAVIVNVPLKPFRLDKCILTAWLVWPTVRESVETFAVIEKSTM